MAQYYQIVGQDHAIQTVTLEELRQYYPNISCVDPTPGVQYVINNQDDNAAQFQTQQVLLTSEQQVVLNTSDTPQQIIVEQSQIAYQQQTQQYSVQEDMVQDYQQQTEINTTQQVYYTTTTTTQDIKSQQIIQATPPALITQQLDQRQIVTQHTPARTITSQIVATPIRQVPQALHNAHLMPQRRLSASPQVQQTIVTSTPQQVSQFTQQVTPVPAASRVIPTTPVTVNPALEGTDDQLVMRGGRYITLGQYKLEVSQTGLPENGHQSVITKPGAKNFVAKVQKPPPKRIRKPANNNNRGGRAKGRGGNNRVTPALEPPQPNQISLPKPLQQLTNKPINQYQNLNKIAQHQPLKQHQQHLPTPQQRPTMPLQPQPMFNQHHPNQIIQQQQQQPQLRTALQQPQPRSMLQPTQQRAGLQAQRPVPKRPVQRLADSMPEPQQHGMPRQQQQQFQQSPNGRVQPLIPLAPTVLIGHNITNQTYSPPSQQQYLDDSSSSVSDEYKDSARMLVCLENGEQRLITFTLPKESCTVQDLLEQVGVPFNADTKIECISNPGCEIEYIVNVGAVNSAPFTMDAQQVLTVDNLGESQECIVSQTGAVIPVTEPLQKHQQSAPKQPPPTQTKQPQQQQQPQQPQQQQPQQLQQKPPEVVDVKPKSPERIPDPPKEIPKFVTGQLAICGYCGYLSEDFNRCQRCKTKLPDDVKRRPSNPIQALADEKKMEKKSTLEIPVPLKLPVLKAIATPSPKPAPKPPRAKKQKPVEMEPVVLTLSSDDDEPDPKTSIANAVSYAKRLHDVETALSARSKEPVITADCDLEFDAVDTYLQGIFGGSKDEEMDVTPQIRTALACRTARIGSYKFIPKEEVVINSLGIQMQIPMLDDPSETFKLFIPTKYILKILGNFNKALPVIFIYVTPSIGTFVRTNLKMIQGSELYFDPLSPKEPCKRITLLPDEIPEEFIEKVKDIYGGKPVKMFEELTTKEANDILIRTCPERSKDITVTRNSLNMCHSFGEIRQLLIYPPGKGGIPINAEDYLCLAQDQFLNDAIIDFYLKYIITDVLAPKNQEKVYVFSSFFYKRLTTKPAKATKRSNPFEVDPTLTPAEKRHCRVKSWTKNVNIFEKDYIIIPINENSHWFLAIICYPGLDGCRSMYDATKIIKIPVKERKKITNTITIGNTTITTVKATSDDKSINSTMEKVIKCEEEEGSDRDEAEGDESELEESESEVAEEVTPEKKKNAREPIKQPCILIFDSLAGASRSKVVATLRDYLTYEHRAKMSSTKTFTKDNIKGACPKVPQQTNFTDCGLYVLQYVESFFKDPISDYYIPIKTLRVWFEEITVTRKREEIASLIKELMLENNRDPSVLPDIAFPTFNGELITGDGHMFSEGEEEEYMEAGEVPAHVLEKLDNSLVSDMYNSDSSGEIGNHKSASTSPNSQSKCCSNDDGKQTESEDGSPKKSNRETMSYLKSKRITRHKNTDANESKKQKINE